jgi:hypothetical protein
MLSCLIFKSVPQKLQFCGYMLLPLTTVLYVAAGDPAFGRGGTGCLPAGKCRFRRAYNYSPCA